MSKNSKPEFRNNTQTVKLEFPEISSIKTERHTCRTCLTSDQAKFSSVFSSSYFNLSYAEMIKKYSGLTIEENDKLPHWLCSHCVRRLLEAHKFFLEVKESDQKLKRFINDFHSVEIKDEHKQSNNSSYDDDDYLSSSNSSSDNEVDRKTYEKTSTSVKVSKTEKTNNDKNTSVFMNECDSLVCAECGITLKSPTELQDHMKCHTGEKPYSCNKCGKAFAMEYTLECHIRKVHERAEIIKAQKNPVCKTCGKKFRWLKDLAVHTRLHTGEMPYLCTYCAKSFAQLSTLYRHIRTHTGEKPFSCQTCGKKFASSSAVTTHQKVHSDSAPFTCNTCGKSMKTKKALIVHINLHTNSKMHVCDQCGTAFATKGSLKMHVSNVHSEKSIPNEGYDKEYSDLSEHMKMHSSDNPFQCVFAACVFKTNQS